MDVLGLLDGKGIHYVHKGGDEYSITCPHQSAHAGAMDSHESFNINIVKLKAHCLACGFKLNEAGLYAWLVGGELDEFMLMGLNIKAALKRLEERDGVPLIEQPAEFMMPPGEPWMEDGYRGISLATYQLLGAMHVKRGRYQNRIAFPITVNGKLVGVDARYLGDAKADKTAKYLRPYNSSCKHDWLFPYDTVKAMNPKLVIVAEGLFHSINGIAKGLPTVCYFGSNNFSMNKTAMLLATGATEAVVFADADKSGYQAAQRISAALSPWFKVTIAVPPTFNSEDPGEAKKDLGDLSKEQIELALSRRAKPLLPECLKKDWEHKIEYGKECRERACAFRKWDEGKAVCGNEFFRKE